MRRAGISKAGRGRTKATGIEQARFAGYQFAGLPRDLDV